MVDMHKLLMFSLFLGVLIAAGCTQSEQPEAQQQAPITEKDADAGGALKEITVRGSEFKFEPSVISVNNGDRVKITFINEGKVSHNLKIDGYGITRTIPVGSSDIIEFVADKTGTIDLWCTVPGHRRSGMEGRLVVN